VDFIVFPAGSPHFPRPVIEAAALGRPAIGTDVGGVNECIVHRETGLLCPPGNAESLAAAIEELIVDRALARSLGDAAHARAAAVHTLSAQRRVIADVYRDVLASPRGALQ
jgi:glycosyltransferase involved in cell wall biosynthesis